MGKKITPRDYIIATLSAWHKENSTDPCVLCNASAVEFDEDFDSQTRQNLQEKLFEMDRLEGRSWTCELLED